MFTKGTMKSATKHWITRPFCEMLCNFGILMGNLQLLFFGGILPLAYHHPNKKLWPSATSITNKDLVLSNTVSMDWKKRPFFNINLTWDNRGLKDA